MFHELNHSSAGMALRFGTRKYKKALQVFVYSIKDADGCGNAASGLVIARDRRSAAKFIRDELDLPLGKAENLKKLGKLPWMGEADEGLFELCIAK